MGLFGTQDLDVSLEETQAADGLEDLIVPTNLLQPAPSGSVAGPHLHDSLNPDDLELLGADDDEAAAAAPTAEDLSLDDELEITLGGIAVGGLHGAGAAVDVTTTTAGGTGGRANSSSASPTDVAKHEVDPEVQALIDLDLL